MRRQSRPFVVEVKRTRKAPTNIWGSSSLFHDAEAPTKSAGVTSASLEGLFKKSPTQAPQQSGSTGSAPRVLPSLLAEESPVLERIAAADHRESDGAGNDDDVFAPRTAPRPARKISAKAPTGPETPAAREPSTEEHRPTTIRPSLAGLWDDPLSQEAFAERAKPDSIEDAAPAIGWPVKPAVDESVAPSEPKGASDLFTGQWPSEEAAPPSKAKPRRKAKASAPKAPKPSSAFALPLDNLGDDDSSGDDETLDTMDTALDIQPLGDAVPRREVSASVVRRRRNQATAALPPGQRWKRRLPSSLR
ncbi:conserved hypothetical protein [Chelatococcus asaccharovorans]|nr:conserved hypothetical protein [Chelatococcus asaccharovorans]CAH1684699.1 conserved hypothetical protein [Chelatococcus asaccharovorans]